MIKTFADKRTQELFAAGATKRFPPDVAKRAARQLEYVDLATHRHRRERSVADLLSIRRRRRG